MELCTALFSCPLLLSVHLNDNEITRDDELMNELLDIFGLSEEELIQVYRLFPTKKTTKGAKVAPQKSVNYMPYLKKYLRYFKPEPPSSDNPKEINKTRLMIKEHLALSKQQRTVE